MNMNKLLLALAGSLLATAAYSQVTVTVTGSTAFRTISEDRAKNLMDAGSIIEVGTFDSSLYTVRGTMSNAVPSLAGNQVSINFALSGSASGMLAVKNSTPQTLAGTLGTAVPDLAFSDVFPASATPSIADSSFDRSVVGVIPFVWVKNNALTGITSLSREKVYLLMTASGAGSGFTGMPASYLGGTGPNAGLPVYLCGRDSGSGTRITAQKVAGFTGTPSLFTLDANNTTYTSVGDAGYSSGGTLRAAIANGARSIGYLGLADYNNISASATSLSYEGVAYQHDAVLSGDYPFWSYEHVVNRKSNLTPNQGLVKTALVNAITNPTFQSTNPLYTGAFVRLADMQVRRLADGGPITSTAW